VGWEAIPDSRSGSCKRATARRGDRVRGTCGRHCGGQIALLYGKKKIIITRDLYCAAKCRSKLRGAGHCTLAKRMPSILKHVAEEFSPARQGIMMTADVGLPDAV